jgi:hypothetical protein
MNLRNALKTLFLKIKINRFQLIIPTMDHLSFRLKIKLQPTQRIPIWKILTAIRIQNPQWNSTNQKVFVKFF